MRKFIPHHIKKRIKSAKRDYNCLLSKFEEKMEREYVPTKLSSFRQLGILK